MASEVGLKIDNRYEVLAELGRGGMGVVYKAMDTELERLVAIKLMTSHVADSPDYVSRFDAEARTAAKMQHPNIAVVYARGRHAGAPYIATEFVEGTPLDELISANAQVSILLKIDYIIQVCNALHYAHTEWKAVHRDVKPANIMVMKDGHRVKVLDFGVARANLSTETESGMAIGTKFYMSPQQIRGERALDGRSDIFSAGVVLYEVITGNVPWTGDSDFQVLAKIVNEPYPPLSNYLPSYPESLDRVLSRALAKDLTSRYQTAEEMAIELAELQAPLKEEIIEAAYSARDGGDLLRAAELASQILRIDTRHGRALALHNELQPQLMKNNGHPVARAEQELLDRARQAMHVEDFESATRILRAGRIDYPSSTEIKQALGVAEEGVSRLTDAKKTRHRESTEILEALLASEQHPDAQLRVVDDALRRNPDNERIQQIASLIRDRQQRLTPVVARAEELESAGQYAEATREWQRVREIYAQYPQADSNIERLTRLAAPPPVAIPAPTGTVAAPAGSSEFGATRLFDAGAAASAAPAPAPTRPSASMASPTQLFQAPGAPPPAASTQARPVPEFEVEAVAPPSVEPRKKSPVSDENVQFTVCRPAMVRPLQWNRLLAFAHLSEKRKDAEPDEPDPIEEVKEQARDILKENAERYGTIAADSSQAVPQAGSITFVPNIPRIEFNPPRQTFLWLESVHRQEFRFRASEELDGTVARGRFTVFLGSVIIAELALNIRVDGERTMTNTSPTLSAARPYRKIFASYSHLDSSMVADFERYSRAIGDKYYRDLVDLRAGEIWNDRLFDFIKDADIFQLFWSSNSMRSVFVKEEWEHALALQRPHFIRPVYWEDPFPEQEENQLPPGELKRLHFYKLPIEKPQPIPGAFTALFGGSQQSPAVRPELKLAPQAPQEQAPGHSSVPMADLNAGLPPISPPPASSAKPGGFTDIFGPRPNEPLRPAPAPPPAAPNSAPQVDLTPRFDRPSSATQFGARPASTPPLQSEPATSTPRSGPCQYTMVRKGWSAPPSPSDPIPPTPNRPATNAPPAPETSAESETLSGRGDRTDECGATTLVNRRINGGTENSRTPPPAAPTQDPRIISPSARPPEAASDDNESDRPDLPSQSASVQSARVPLIVLKTLSSVRFASALTAVFCLACVSIVLWSGLFSARRAMDVPTTNAKPSSPRVETPLGVQPPAATSFEKPVAPPAPAPGVVTGSVTVETNHPALLIIDRQEQGKVLGRQKVDLPIGRHTIAVSSPDFEVKRSSVGVTVKKGKDIAVRFNLTPKNGDAVVPTPKDPPAVLIVKSLPGAEVVIDAASAGTTNAEGVLIVRPSAGRHFVIVRRLGYERFETVITAGPGETVIKAALIPAGH